MERKTRPTGRVLKIRTYINGVKVPSEDLKKYVISSSAVDAIMEGVRARVNEYRIESQPQCAMVNHDDETQ